MVKVSCSNRKLLDICMELRKRIDQPLGEPARWLKRVVQSWLNYHAVPSNSHRIGRFVDELTRHWLWAIRRRSQRGKSSWTWARMHLLVRRHLPKARPIQSNAFALNSRQEPYEVIFHLRICAHTDPEPRGVFPALIPEILKCYF